MGRHRDQTGQAELVVGHQAHHDDGGPERLGQILRCPAICEAQNVGRHDQQDPEGIIDHAVNAGRQNSHDATPWNEARGANAPPFGSVPPNSATASRYSATWSSVEVARWQNVLKRPDQMARRGWYANRRMTQDRAAALSNVSL